MKTIGLIGKKLSREEQKQISGGITSGCASLGHIALNYTRGCCVGLVVCNSYCTQFCAEP